jgi:hypothetical protein
MNERINELAKQADLYAISMQNETGAFYFNSYNEKFAELIIQECVSVAHPKLNDVGEWAAGMRLVQKRIKQHFGVEE